MVDGVLPLSMALSGTPVCQLLSLADLPYSLLAHESGAVRGKLARVAASFHHTHLLPSFGKNHLDELTTQDGRDAQKSVAKVGYAPGTANKFIVQINYMYNVAKKQGIPSADFNPAAGVKQYPVQGRERFLNQEEIHRLRDAVEKRQSKQLKYFYALLLMLGCRK